MRFLTWLKSLFLRSPIKIHYSYKNGENLTDWEITFLQKAECPDCGQKSLLKGPSGCLSTNILCKNCKSEFNVCLEMLNFSPERISDKHKCDPSRACDLYGVLK